MTKQQTILAVDDDAINIDVMTEMLEDEYRLITATSGEEALQVVALDRPDLVLLDVMMPGIDGYETCRRLRANADLRSLHIVLVSAKATIQERLAGYAAGADDYVTKPFDQGELMAKIQVFLRLRQRAACKNSACPLET